MNFSKKRKNRMRNDEAAIIALSKSRSQYLHKDTDSLVDNEAVIVYDERTALWKLGVGGGGGEPENKPSFWYSRQ